MNKIVKNAIILTIITLVAGVGLGLVYEITKEPIAISKERAKQEAYKSVISDAAEFVEYADFDAEEAADILAEAGLESNTIDEVMEAQSAGGEVLGYVITSTTPEGYGGNIQISTGILEDGTVAGISILAISETAGLGMKATESSFQDQFKDKNVEQFSYTKSGASADGEVDAISGATITTSAVTNDVNAALAYYYSVLEGGSTNE